MNSTIRPTAFLLSDCLVALLQYSGHHISSESLSSVMSEDDDFDTSVTKLIRACREHKVEVTDKSHWLESSSLSALTHQESILLAGPVVSSNKDFGEGAETENAFCVLVLTPSASESGVYDVRLVEGTSEIDQRSLSLEELDLKQFSYVLVCEPQSLHQKDRQQVEVATGFSAWLKSEIAFLRPLYRDAIVATALVNLFALVLPLFMMNVYDRVVPNQAIETLWVLASGVCLILASDMLVKFIRVRFIERAGQHLDVVLSSKLFARMLDTRAEYLPDRVGAIVGQVRDFDFIKQFVASATLVALVEIPFILIFLLVIYFIAGSVVLAPLLAILFLVVYGWAMQLSMRRALSDVQQASDEKTAVLVESLTTLETVQAFNVSGRQRNLWEAAVYRMARASNILKFKSGSITIVASSSVQLTLIAIVIMGVYQIESQALTLGGLIAVVLLGGRALAPMAQIAHLLVQFHHAASAKNALDVLCSHPADHDPQVRYHSLKEKELDVSFRRFSYVYPNGYEALKDINLDIQYGERVGIIGRIGSGKSSMMRALLGFGESVNGSLRLGGVELGRIDKKELRQRIAYVSQDVELFSGSLRENICLRNPLVEQARLEKCVAMAGLQEFVNAQAQGLDVRLGERGKGLSGGQKQCVSIARALVADADIFLFDELTSAMDNQTELQVMQAIEPALAGKTLILSTHRASLLNLVDRIIVIDEGKVIADGKKSDVLEALRKGLIKPVESKERQSPIKDGES